VNKKSTAERAQIVRCLVEGNSIRSTVRMTGASKNTISKLLVELGTACALFQDETIRDLKCKEIQCDEIWSFVGMKEKNVPEEKIGEFGYGDVWTWTALCADSKLMVCWNLGMRDADAAQCFMDDVASRLANRVQLTTDGHKVYLKAVLNAFEGEVDYAMLVKKYGNDYSTPERMYSPAVCTGCDKKAKIGNPDEKKISTSYVERANLTMRMSMRRFTRLTNGFSKKLENHAAAIALHFMYYNFARVHATLKTTPAVAAGLTDKVWTVEDIVQLLD
jgi:IS1 family transposase